MIYKSIFDIRGTVEQQAIVINAINSIHFDWSKLVPPKGVFIVGWADLNSRQMTGKFHAGDHPGFDKDVHVLEGEMGGRRFVYGIMYPSTGNMYVESTLIFHPALAMQTVSAEVSHNVDYFFMTDRMREQLNLLTHNGVNVPHGHTGWWEVSDYNAEYYSLVAESWMGGFTFAYSDMEFDMNSFVHKFTKAQAPAIRKILGIERTDFVPPAPLPVYKTFPPSLIYHRNSHYPKKTGTQTTNITGLVPCKFCKP